MTFDELLAMFDGLDGIADNEGAGAFREAFGEFGRVSEGANARITELETALDEMERKYLDSAARNYELMSAVTAPAGEEEAEEGEPDGEESIDALFGDEEE